MRAADTEVAEDEQKESVNDERGLEESVEKIL